MQSPMIELYQWAQKFYGGRSLLLVPYAYPFAFGIEGAEVQAGATVTTIINISANADFIALGLRHVLGSTSSSDVQTISNRGKTTGRLLLTDTASGEPFTNNATNVATYSSNGLNEIPFSCPRLLNGRSAINAQFSLASESDPVNRVEFVLHGVLVRAWSDDARSPGEGLFARDYQ